MQPIKAERLPGRIMVCHAPAVAFCLLLAGTVIADEPLSAHFNPSMTETATIERLAPSSTDVDHVSGADTRRLGVDGVSQ